MTDEQPTARTGSQIISDHCPLWYLTDLYELEPPTVDQVRAEAWVLIRELAQELDRVTGATEISDVL